MIIATIYFEIKGRWVVVKDKVITQKKKYVNLTMQRTQQ
jgi:serine protease inhibitor